MPMCAQKGGRQKKTHSTLESKDIPPPTPLNPDLAWDDDTPASCACGRLDFTSKPSGPGNGGSCSCLWSPQPYVQSVVFLFSDPDFSSGWDPLYFECTTFCPLSTTSLLQVNWNCAAPRICPLCKGTFSTFKKILSMPQVFERSMFLFFSLGLDMMASLRFLENFPHVREKFFLPSSSSSSANSPLSFL